MYYLTKKRVAERMRKRAPNPPAIPGDLVDFIDDDFDISEKCFRNALRWGWLDEYGRLTRKGFQEV